MLIAEAEAAPAALLSCPLLLSPQQMALLLVVRAQVK